MSPGITPVTKELGPRSWRLAAARRPLNGQPARRAWGKKSLFPNRSACRWGCSHEYWQNSRQLQARDSSHLHHPAHRMLGLNTSITQHWQPQTEQHLVAVKPNGSGGEPMARWYTVMKVAGSRRGGGTPAAHQGRACPLTRAGPVRSVRNEDPVRHCPGI